MLSLQIFYSKKWNISFWLLSDNNELEYTAGYKVKHNNFGSCEHLSTYYSKGKKFILHLVTASRAEQQQYPKGNNTKWNRNDDDNNNVMFSLPNYRNLIQYTPLKLKKNVS